MRLPPVLKRQYLKLKYVYFDVEYGGGEASLYIFLRLDYPNIFEFIRFTTSDMGDMGNPVFIIIATFSLSFQVPNFFLNLNKTLNLNSIQKNFLVLLDIKYFFF